MNAFDFHGIRKKKLRYKRPLLQQLEPPPDMARRGSSTQHGTTSTTMEIEAGDTRVACYLTDRRRWNSFGVAANSRGSQRNEHTRLKCPMPVPRDRVRAENGWHLVAAWTAGGCDRQITGQKPCLLRRPATSEGSKKNERSGR